MKTHYTNFGVQQAPQCADRDGFVSYSKRAVARLQRDFARGVSVQTAIGRAHCSPGSVFVATHDARIDAWRSSYAD